MPLQWAIIRVITLNYFTERRFIFQSRIGWVSFKSLRFIWSRLEQSMKNPGGGLQWHSSVIFIPIPRLVNHLCTFPLTFDSKPQSQVRIRTCNNNLSFCLGIVSCQIRGRGSRATGPLGHPRESPRTSYSSAGTNITELFNCYFIHHLPPSAQSSPLLHHDGVRANRMVLIAL